MRVLNLMVASRDSIFAKKQMHSVSLTNEAKETRKALLSSRKERNEAIKFMEEQCAFVGQALRAGELEVN